MCVKASMYSSNIHMTAKVSGPTKSPYGLEEGPLVSGGTIEGLDNLDIMVIRVLKMPVRAHLSCFPLGTFWISEW